MRKGARPTHVPPSARTGRVRDHQDLVLQHGLALDARFREDGRHLGRGERGVSGRRVKQPSAAALPAAAHPSGTRRSGPSGSEKTCPHRLQGAARHDSGASVRDRPGCGPRASCPDSGPRGRTVADHHNTERVVAHGKRAVEPRGTKEWGWPPHFAMLSRCVAAAAARAFAAPRRRARRYGHVSRVTYPAVPRSAVAGLLVRRAATVAAAPGALAPGAARLAPVAPTITPCSRAPRCS